MTAFLLMTRQPGHPVHLLRMRDDAALGGRYLRAQSAGRSVERALVEIRDDMQGVEPPSPRSEEWCDAATKTHINDNPAYYYNYAFATVFKFQLHDYIARKILHQPPQSCNYADNKEVGTWLNNILKKGSTEDWRRVLKEATGEDISTRAMAEYFKPLQSWLEEQNKGRQIGWE